jgi:hypothetical protein
LSVGIISTDGVKNMDLVLDELLGGNFERGIAFFDIATLDAIGFVGELYILR